MQHNPPFEAVTRLNMTWIKSTAGARWRRVRGGWQNRRMLKKLAMIALPAWLAAWPVAPAAESTDATTRAIMHEVAGTLEVLLPLSLDSDEFLSPGLVQNHSRVRHRRHGEGES